MKKILLMTVILLGVILSGCGSDEETENNLKDKNTTQENSITQEENTTRESNGTVYAEEDYSEALKYNYNQDKSAIQELLPLHVNRYEKVQTKLESLRGDNEQFNNYYDWYIGELISTQRAIDTHPSYAPRGNSKSLIVEVINGKIDYSSYKLIGDIDENGEVDFEDEVFIKETIANGNMDSQHDLNGDNSVDTKDILEFISRIGTEIKSFDFYTTSGEKLDIPNRGFNDSRSFNYSGSESQVMVVAKDANGVSGFSSGLSDIDGLWYVGLSKEKQQKIMHKEEGMEATNPDRIKFVKEALTAIEQEPTPYLLGWSVVVKFITLDKSYLELDSNGILDMDTFFFKPIEDKIDSHFNKTNMGEPKLPRVLQKDKYFYKRGSTEEGITIHVKAYNAVIKRMDYINGKNIISKSCAYANSVVFTSKENKKLEGEIKKDGKKVKGGVLKAKRIGPNPKDNEYEGKIEDSKYKLKNIPFGGYELKYISKCECEKLLDSSYVFKKEENKDFSIDKKEVKVKLTVLDNDNNLLKDKNVRIEPDECMVETDSFSDISDDNAKVEFNNVPIGKYRVYVDNKESKTIQVCDEFDGEALGEQLWDIDLKYEAKRNPDASYSTFSAFKEWHWKKVKIATIDESMKTYAEVDSLFNQKEFYYPFSEHSNIYLSHTNLYDKEKIGFNTNVKGETGIGLVYYKNGGYLQRSNFYCIEGIAELFAEYNVGKTEMASLTGENYIMMRNSMRNAYSSFGCNLDFYTITTDLKSTQANDLVEHKAFTVKRTGDWGNLEGKSTVTVEFRPSK